MKLDKDGYPTKENLDHYHRRKNFQGVFDMLQNKMDELYEPRFITYPDECLLIEAVSRSIEAKEILELGMYTGFCTLHLIRAVYPGGHVTSIDVKPAHDEEFFSKREIVQCFRFIKGHSNDVLPQLKAEGKIFDLVFVDSDHSIDVTEKERQQCWEVTRPGSVFVFHDCPQMACPDHKHDGPIYVYLYDLVKKGIFKGAIFPTPMRFDCLKTFGEGYNKKLNPHLGIFIRT